ncbi:CK5P3 protein, partial [Callaeas wilsoni]|nr:CK5P3 protein [Callaeas wilsoni]
VAASPGAEVVPLLRFVGSSGNATVFRWRTGLEPLRVERPEPREAPEPPQEDAVGPGRGREGTGTPPERSAGRFWGAAVAHGGVWAGGCWAAVLGCPGGMLSWIWGPPPAPERVARGSDALTVLENPETRNQFIDELMELELFLAQRLLELEDEADVVAMSQLQLAPAVLQGQSRDRVQAQLATTRELLAQLCSRSVQHLCMILASPRC